MHSLPVLNGNPVASHVKLEVLEKHRHHGLWAGNLKVFPCVSSSSSCDPSSDTTDFHELTHDISFSIQRDLLPFSE